MGLIVYTAIFGHTDPLHEPLYRRGARFICFTDHEELQSRQWEIVLLPKQSQPTRASRCLKILSHETFPEAAATLWLDAAFSMRVPPERLLREHPADFTTFRHRDRQRIRDEAEAVIRLGKAHGDAVRRQVEAYREAGWDTDRRPQREISNGGALLRRHTPQVCAMNDLWWSEVCRHTLRDQLSIDYCAWRCGLRLGRFKGVHSNNPLFRFNYYERPTNDF